MLKSYGRIIRSASNTPSASLYGAAGKARPVVTSVAPTAQARAVLQPLGTGDVRIESGFWAERLRANREVTLRTGYRQLEDTGRLENLRAAGRREEGAFRGIRFNDSDVYKWLEAVGWELARSGSEKLARLARDAIEVVAAAQLDDGYLNSYCQLVDPAWRYTDLAMGHELYCAGHLIQAAVAHTRATGDQTLLAVARRFADEIDGVFGDGRREGVCGHPEIETALVELYRLTGESRYLRLACTFIDRRGRGLLADSPRGLRYHQDHEPIREATGVAGHAVRALYLACGVTDAYLETGDESLLRAVVRQWDDMVSTKTYLTGGVGSRHANEEFGDAYELPPDRAYCETCAAVASVMWSWRLLLATGEARYADLIERTLYNAFLAGLSLDGRSFFYVNPLQSRGGHGREPWYPVACCPPNVMRLLSSLEQYVATCSDMAVQLHQYVSGSVQASAFAALRVATDYPWDGRVEIAVTESAGDEWALALRIPAWCTEAAVAVNGGSVLGELGPGGYVSLRRRWRPGDMVVLDLPMPPRLTTPHPRLDGVRGCIAVERGPLVYCLEQVDLRPAIDLGGVSILADAGLEPIDRPDLLGGVVAIEAAGAVVTADGWRAWPYREAGAAPPAHAPGSSVPLTAIPYFAWANRGAGEMRVWIPQR